MTGFDCSYRASPSEYFSWPAEWRRSCPWLSPRWRCRCCRTCCGWIWTRQVLVHQSSGEEKDYLGDITTVTWLTPADPLPLPLPLLLTEKMSRLSERDLMISLVTSHSVTAAVTRSVHLQHQTVLLLLAARNLSHLKYFNCDFNFILVVKIF